MGYLFDIFLKGKLRKYLFVKGNEYCMYLVLMGCGGDVFKLYSCMSLFFF